ncbi:MAG: hypothetical protein Q8N13_06580 [Acidovorax sp.]|nr:hypothetical protein [Acidovorax sp.]
MELIGQVVRVVDGWQAHFAQQGVRRADMELLHASIDRETLPAQRSAEHLPEPRRGGAGFPRVH